MTTNMEATIGEVQKTEKRVQFLQYVNTAILTAIAVFAMVIFLFLKDIRDSNLRNIDQHAEFSKELLRLKTVQDINVNNVLDLQDRVTSLEKNYVDDLKIWIDQNYIRKPQK